VIEAGRGEVSGVAAVQAGQVGVNARGVLLPAVGRALAQEPGKAAAQLRHAAAFGHAVLP